MNKTVLKKDDRIEWQIISDDEIFVDSYLKLYEYCEIIEEKYIDDLLTQTITHIVDGKETST